MRRPPLNAIRAFEATARHLSFTKAADELNLTPSALSYQVRMLEDVLSVKLFKRLNRAIELTPTGLAIFPGIRDAFLRLDETFRLLQPETPDNILVLATGPAFVAKWLSPRIAGFLEAHPDLELRISANLKLVDFNTEEVDIGVRFGFTDDDNLHVEPLMKEAVLPLCSPGFLEQHGGSLSLGDLHTVTLLHDDSLKFMQNQTTWETWLDKVGVESLDTDRGLHFNHANHSLDAAAEGAGLVLARQSLAEHDIRTGRLIAPFDTMLPVEGMYYLAGLPAAFEKPKVKAFRDWIHAEIAQLSRN
ncbi:MAG: transcriptional regulator GcvA [Stappiaceae bacterium]